MAASLRPAFPATGHGTWQLGQRPRYSGGTGMGKKLRLTPPAAIAFPAAFFTGPFEPPAAALVVSATDPITIAAITSSLATAVAVKVDPAVVLGSLRLVPAPVVLMGAVVDPAIVAGGGATVTPAPAEARPSAANPDVAFIETGLLLINIAGDRLLLNTGPDRLAL